MIEQDARGFRVELPRPCARTRSRPSPTRARIEADASGNLSFAAEGEALTDFLTNRTGFVVLHPIEGVSGAAGRGRARRRQRRAQPLSRADRPGLPVHGPPRADPRAPARACASPAAWRATPSRWRTSATGWTPPTRPMSARSPCPGPTRSPRARSLASAFRSRLTGSARRPRPRRRRRCHGHDRLRARSRGCPPSASPCPPSTPRRHWS